MSPDFNKKTVETLAKRAAFKCSNPDCRVTTVGPNANPEKSTVIGEAAHIFGARPDAKRFKSEMSDNARAAITNGIWLCRNCHKLVDTDVQLYSSEILFAWREEHEKYAQAELGTSTERIRFERQISQLSEFEDYPPLIRRIVIDKPDGWEWRLTAELMRYLNQPLFRRISDLRDGLYIKPQQHLSGEEVVGWVRNRMIEFSNLISPICSLFDRLSQSWGAPGESGSVEEIHHICRLIRDSLEQVVLFEEQIYFTNAPEEYEKVLNLLKDILGSQAQKLAEVPDTLDEVVSLIGKDHGGDSDYPRTIKKTIVFELPKGWEKRIIREIKRAERTSSHEGGLGFWSISLIVVVLFWLIFSIF